MNERRRARVLAIAAATTAAVLACGAAWWLFTCLRRREAEGAEAEGAALRSESMWVPDPEQRSHILLPPPPASISPSHDTLASRRVFLFLVHPLPFGHVWGEASASAAASAVRSALASAAKPHRVTIVCMDATMTLRERTNDISAAATAVFLRPPLHELPHRIFTLAECLSKVGQTTAKGDVAVVAPYGSSFENGWDEFATGRVVPEGGVIFTATPPKHGRANRFPIVAGVNPRGVPLVASARAAHKALVPLPSTWVDATCIISSMATLCQVCPADLRCGVQGMSPALSVSAATRGVQVRYVSDVWCRLSASAPSLMLEDFVDRGRRSAVPDIPSTIVDAVAADRRRFVDEERRIAEAVWGEAFCGGRTAAAVDVGRFFLNVTRDEDDVVAKYGSAEALQAVEEEAAVRLALHVATRMKQGEGRKREKTRKRKGKGEDKGDGEAGAGAGGGKTPYDLLASLSLILK